MSSNAYQWGLFCLESGGWRTVCRFSSEDEAREALANVGKRIPNAHYIVGPVDLEWEQLQHEYDAPHPGCSRDGHVPIPKPKPKPKRYRAEFYGEPGVSGPGEILAEAAQTFDTDAERDKYAEWLIDVINESPMIHVVDRHGVMHIIRTRDIARVKIEEERK